MEDAYGSTPVKEEPDPFAPSRQDLNLPSNQKCVKASIDRFGNIRRDEHHIFNFAPMVQVSIGSRRSTFKLNSQ
jgi:hypothetical protein